MFRVKLLLGPQLESSGHFLQTHIYSKPKTTIGVEKLIFDIGQKNY